MASYQGATQLSVNLNKVALLRNARNETPVDIAAMAQLCVSAGAGGITVHPRPDSRHIRREDIVALGDWLGEHTEVELNIEGNPLVQPRGEAYPGLLALVELSGAQQCTLVPDSDEQSTSDHGWDLRTEKQHLSEIVDRLKGLGVRVSVFMEPDPGAMELLAEIGADRVELYTGPYAWAHAQGSNEPQVRKWLEMHAETARAARAVGLQVNAGHDLNRENLTDYVSEVQPAEVSIGHALILDALQYGLYDTVKMYINCIMQGHSVEPPQ